jgi:pimeloyl-ACP methyl ester carboxylesterase
MKAEPFEIRVSENVLADLGRRLTATRWPPELARGWALGASVDYMAELVDWWRTSFDWRRQEAAINTFSHFKADVDGVRLHFVYERGRGPNAIPLLLIHGWPSSFYEFLPVVSQLADPERYGGDARDSFDVVVPSLPGYGFSDPLPATETSSRIPALLTRLMTDTLGHDRFAAHGGDIGGMVANRIALEQPERLFGIHVTFVAEPSLGSRPQPPLSRRERALLEGRPRGHELAGGYAHIQRTRPQTLSYGLNDSPLGLAAWIIDKWREWSDCGGDVERRFSKDELLTTVMIYWTTETIASSFRVYADWALGSASAPAAWEGRADVPSGVDSRPLGPEERIETPAAVALFHPRWPREWADRAYTRLERWTEMPSGGHFAAMEEPTLLVEDMRAFFRGLR